MGTAYIETTITAELGGVTLFEADCTAEVEYEVDGGALADWHIRDFKFTETKPLWDDAAKVWTRTKATEVWCPDILRPTLMEFVSKDEVEGKLIEMLSETGEMYPSDELRRDYHSAVL